jgi:subtilase family serine protease
VNYVRPQVEELEQRTVPSVLTPAQVRHAYGFDQVRFSVNGQTIVGDGSGQTIAIVNAYNNTRIFSDLDTFDRSFALSGWQTLYAQYGPASRFLTQVNPEGTPGPDTSGGLWWLESALDVEWAHAIAPGAKILLVQARSNTFADLLGAAAYAENQPGVVVVSMSWGSHEFYGETFYDAYFGTPAGHLGGSNGRGGPKLAGGISFVAASGDQGAPGLWPAMSPRVLAVGGTRLSVTSAGTYTGEIAWTGSGGGVSTQEGRPAYQATVDGSGQRYGPDVAYNGDPASGVYVYSSMPLYGQPGSWWQVGGTSAGAPQWAALIAIADQGRALQGKGSLDGPAQTLPAIYNLPATDFHDVTQGTNGYAAHVGYDLATGRGTPIANRVIADLLRADGQGRLVTTTTVVSGRPAGALVAQTSVFVLATDAPDRPPVAGPDAFAFVTVLAPTQGRTISFVELSRPNAVMFADRGRTAPATIGLSGLSARPSGEEIGRALSVIFADTDQRAEPLPIPTLLEETSTDQLPWEAELDEFFADSD